MKGVETALKWYRRQWPDRLLKTWLVYWMALIGSVACRGNGTPSRTTGVSKTRGLRPPDGSLSIALVLRRLRRHPSPRPRCPLSAVAWATRRNAIDNDRQGGIEFRQASAFSLYDHPSIHQTPSDRYRFTDTWRTTRSGLRHRFRHAAGKTIEGHNFNRRR